MPALGDGEPRISLLQSPEAARMGWDTFRSAVGMLDMFDWSGIRDAMNRAHSVGHIIDPTGYKDLIYSTTVADNVELAQAAETFLSTVHGIVDAARSRDAQKAQKEA